MKDLFLKNGIYAAKVVLKLLKVWVYTGIMLYPQWRKIKHKTLHNSVFHPDNKVWLHGSTKIPSQKVGDAAQSKSFQNPQKHIENLHDCQYHKIPPPNVTYTQGHSCHSGKVEDAAAFGSSCPNRWTFLLFSTSKLPFFLTNVSNLFC